MPRQTLAEMIPDEYYRFPNKEKEYYYRYEGHYSPNGGYDIMGEWVSSNSGTYSIKADKYEVLKHTPKGVWLNVYGYTDKPNNRNAKFVNASHTKRFALPTKAEALISYLARKDREIGIYTARLREAEGFKKLALQAIQESPLKK